MIILWLQIKSKSKKKCLNYQLKIADFLIFLFVLLKYSCLTFLIKKKHVLHYENLQLYLKLGLKLEKYIVIRNQWLEPYNPIN